MKLIKYIIPVAALAATTSCEKELDFEYRDIPAQQVIEGLLSQDGASIRLTETVATDEPFNDNTLTDADVVIKDLTDDISYVLAPDDSGSFSLPGLAGIPGHSYQLTVTINDNTYSSTSTMAAAYR